MTLWYLLFAGMLIIGVGVGMSRRMGWRRGLAAAVVVLLIARGVYGGLLILIVNSMLSSGRPLPTTPKAQTA